jgi:hypothetical protein
MALKPILDDGKQAMAQMDACNTWSVGIANLLGVSLADFSSTEIPDQYAELRERITKTVKEMNGL